jgi:CcmD family protein
MENLGYLFAGYTAIWAVIFAYILFIQNKQRRIQRQIDALRMSLENNGSSGSGKTQD